MEFGCEDTPGEAALDLSSFLAMSLEDRDTAFIKAVGNVLDHQLDEAKLMEFLIKDLETSLEGLAAYLKLPTLDPYLYEYVNENILRAFVRLGIQKYERGEPFYNDFLCSLFGVEDVSQIVPGPEPLMVDAVRALLDKSKADKAQLIGCLKQGLEDVHGEVELVLDEARFAEVYGSSLADIQERNCVSVELGSSSEGLVESSVDIAQRDLLLKNVEARLSEVEARLSGTDREEISRKKLKKWVSIRNRLRSYSKRLHLLDQEDDVEQFFYEVAFYLFDDALRQAHKNVTNPSQSMNMKRMTQVNVWNRCGFALPVHAWYEYLTPNVLIDSELLLGAGPMNLVRREDGYVLQMGELQAVDLFKAGPLRRELDGYLSSLKVAPSAEVQNALRFCASVRDVGRRVYKSEFFQIFDVTQEDLYMAMYLCDTISFDKKSMEMSLISSEMDEGGGEPEVLVPGRVSVAVEELIETSALSEKKDQLEPLRFLALLTDNEKGFVSEKELKERFPAYDLDWLNGFLYSAKGLRLERRRDEITLVWEDPVKTKAQK